MRVAVLPPTMTDTPAGSSMDSPLASADSVRREYDWTETTPSTAVLDAVAVASGTDPTTFPPLYSCVDSDALDSLLVPGDATGFTSSVEISFSYAGHEVLVRSDGVVVVDPPTTSGGR